MAVTVPEEDPTATRPEFALLHVPPPAQVSVALEPSHTDEEPEIAPGAAFTVMTFVLLHPFTT